MHTLRWGLLIGLLLLLLLSMTAASAGSYTVTTNAKEDALMQADLDAQNQRKGAAKELPEYVQNVLNSYLKPMKADDSSKETRKACQAYNDLAQADRDTILALLGGRSPC